MTDHAPETYLAFSIGAFALGLVGLALSVHNPFIWLTVSGYALAICGTCWNYLLMRRVRSHGPGGHR